LGDFKKCTVAKDAFIYRSKKYKLSLKKVQEIDLIAVEVDYI